MNQVVSETRKPAIPSSCSARNAGTIDASRIQAWDMTQVKDYMASRMMYSDPNLLDRMEKEYKRFMLICASNPGKATPIAAELDPMWHTHLIFTRDYTGMCNKLGRFIHHKPSMSHDEEEAIRKAYVNTFEEYRVMFGEEPPPELWGASICYDCCEAV